MLTATVSGSFHRHLTGIYTAVGDLRAAGVNVLSPADPRVVDHLGEFLFVASDRLRSIRMVQDRHLQCIGASTFLWLVTPDGYVGPSASMEIGYAVSTRTPIFCTTAPTDTTLREYVQVIPNVRDAIAFVRHKHAEIRHNPLLIDPSTSIEGAFRHLNNLHVLFSTSKLTDDAAKVNEELQRTKHYLTETFILSP